MKQSLFPVIFLIVWGVCPHLAGQYQIPEKVMAAGGGSAANQQFRLNGTAGQGAIGPANNNILHLNAGFWPTIIPATTPGILEQFPFGIGAGSAELWNNAIFYFGGADTWTGNNRSARIYRLDPSAWIQYDTIPDNNVWDLNSVLLGDEVYLLSGWPSGANLIRKFNLVTHSWEYLPNSPNIFSWGTTTEHVNGKLYLFNQNGSVFEYNISSGEWASKTGNSSSAYLGLNSVVYQDAIYLVGYLNSHFYKYTPAADQWTQLEDIPYSVASGAMGILDNRIYYAGGSATGNLRDIYDTVISYDLAGGGWSVSDLYISSERVHLAEVQLNNRFYVLGGFDSTGSGQTIVEELAPRIAVGIAPAEQIPEEFKLLQNFPNPFNPVTTIGFQLPVAAEVRLDIFNVLGQHVRELASVRLSAGSHHLQWDARNDAGQAVGSGVYFYRLEIAAPRKGQARNVQSRKMLLIK